MPGEYLGIKEVLLLSPFSHQNFPIQSDFYYKTLLKLPSRSPRVNTLLTNQTPFICPYYLSAHHLTLLTTPCIHD